MGRPLIGVTGYQEPARWADWVREAVLSPVPYTRVLERAGALPVVLPPGDPRSAAELVGRLDGVVFAHGAPVDPALYGGVRAEGAAPDTQRDRFELALVRAAVAAGTPFLAVDRGMHVLNIALGGNLIPHLPDAVEHDRHAPDPLKLSDHPVLISVSSATGAALGDAATVPASHTQAPQRLGDGLQAVAWFDDRIVEAVELAGHPFGVGVQWRPEEGDDPRLFAALADAAAA
ncbi:gamma-glutamyl-gamma-aminobutyrate hydrolase family protein [Allonocardiopsis opalescens]|uniref:Putative glutamine amidotransferase n=1 Tax=Allonocardiopsis opalescens TaxID=1144618 RepID=A0A2T0Q4L0_9ACTN|nr:gamma-glutamyl-gamma-aminobutyrate hydrolase family protein [Allonocardiopsis opalescens]PRX98746.1 putative glutamine amidotransferase [Allonocardiopsis opalescens]